MPVIKIQTVNPKDPENPLAFITEPVADTVKIRFEVEEKEKKVTEPTTWGEQCEITIENDKGRVELENVLANVKVRGNWSSVYDKKSFKIKFDEEQNLFGMHKGKKFRDWIFLAEWNDYSMMRDYVSQKFMKLINERLYSTDCQLVEVYINNQYWGVYVLVEQQESSRIGITEPKDKENINNTEIGYLLEYDNYAALKDVIENYEPLVESGYIKEIERDYIKMDDYGEYYDINGEKVRLLNQYYTIKSDYNDECKARIKNYMDNVWKICREAVVNKKFYEFDSSNKELIPSSATNVEECVSKVIDIDSLVSTFIQQEIVCDLDLSWSSFYMDFDLNPDNPKRLTFEAPWDFDACYGNHFKRQIKPTGFPQWDITHLCSVTEKIPCAGNPWTIIFASEPWFKMKVRVKWGEIQKKEVKEQIISILNAVSNNPIYIEAFNKNYDKWKNNINWQNKKDAENEQYIKQNEATDIIIEFIERRWQMLDRDFITFESSNKINKNFHSNQ